MPAILVIVFWLAMVGAWLTHVIVCLQDAAWGFLIAGALVFPIAIIHGVGLWFGGMVIMIIDGGAP